ncbi:MAG: glycosyltransferase family 4 protein [Chloroflexi bacterium]|nr:glycosyltransferase family 4 protein [Chloroflexota bacterium]
MRRIGILVSARINQEERQLIRQGDHPRRDYFELADVLGATIINHEQVLAKAWRGRSKTAPGPAMAQAWHAFQRRHEYDCILSDSEHVGIPLALLFKLAGVQKAHVMIAHRLSTPKKGVFFRALGVQSHIDKIICYGSAQRDYASGALGIPRDKLTVVLHPADHRFWQPMAVERERLIASAGLEFRDYPTLIEAIRGVDADVRIAAASPWSRRPNETSGRELPPNVTVVAHTYRELRDLYARSQFVVIPLYETEFQAGTLVMYEAMSMGKAVIATRTKGQGDVLVEGTTGLYAPPGDADALRRAIRRLLDNPAEAQEMGRNARRAVEAELNLDAYVENVARTVIQEIEHAAARQRCPAPA